jgi:phosphonopyruvate decarboxylase
MKLVDALNALRSVRQSEIVVTTMGGAREWLELGTHPRDFLYVPSSMGQASSIGLGLALARPDLKIVVCNGDGSMLMNLGSLVTITAQSPPNLTLIVLDNGVYEVTGGQPTLATAALRRDGTNIDFASIARSCGFQAVSAFDDVALWRTHVRGLIDQRGPTFVHLRVQPLPEGGAPRFPGPSPQRARAFRDELARIKGNAPAD